MRTINPNFTGFICGQWRNGAETIEAVMFYEAGKQQTLFVPHSDRDTARLYRALKRLDKNVSDLIKTVVRI